MGKCIMCQQEFNEKDLDFAGRCEYCFRQYIQMKDYEKPHIPGPNVHPSVGRPGI